MMGNIFCTRQKIGSSSLEKAAETKRATVIVIKSDRHHINETGAQLDLRYKAWKTSRPLKPKSIQNHSPRFLQTHSRGRTG